MAGSAVTYGLVVGAVGLVSGWGGQVLTSCLGAFREGRQDKRRRQARKKEEELASDAAAWRLVKRALDDLAHNTKVLAATVKPAPDGGMVLNAQVAPPDEAWGDAYNRLVRVVDEVSFHDEAASELLTSLKQAALRYWTQSSWVPYLTQMDTELRRAGVPVGYQADQMNSESLKAAEDIGKYQTEVNTLIKASVGFHRVYAAPLIEPPAL